MAFLYTGFHAYRLSCIKPGKTVNGRQTAAQYSRICAVGTLCHRYTNNVTSTKVCDEQARREVQVRSYFTTTEERP